MNQREAALKQATEAIKVASEGRENENYYALVLAVVSVTHAIIHLADQR